MLRRIVPELRGAAVQSYVGMWCLVVGHETALPQFKVMSVYDVLMGWGEREGGATSPLLLVHVYGVMSVCGVLL